VAGESGPPVLEYFASFRANAITSPDFNWRNAASGNTVFVGDGTNLFTTWKQAQVAHVEAAKKSPRDGYDIGPTWDTHMLLGDWMRNVLAGLAMTRDTPLPLELRAKAMDGAILFRSERQHPPEGMPQITPKGFFGAFENLNSLCAYGSTWRWDVPPVIRVGQSCTVTADAPAGTVVGLLVTDGGLPRASKPEASDAFIIVEQPAGNPFAVSRGGALKVAGKPPAGVHVVKAYAATYDEEDKEHRGPTVEVKIKVVNEGS
jgi:hypothetical protein